MAEPTVFRGWWIVIGLGVVTASAYGVLSYSFPVLVEAISGEMGWSQATVIGAYSVATLVAGLSAIPVGIAVDRHGARGVMLLGTICGALGLVLWSVATSIAVFYGVAVVIGIAKAGVYYEPAFAIVARWFRSLRARALALLTVIGGLARIVFVPLSAVLVEVLGWRSALLVLACIFGGVATSILLGVIRNAPEEVGSTMDGDPDAHGQLTARVDHTPSRSVHASVLARSHSDFVWLVASFAISAAVSATLTIHFIPILLGRGYSLTTAGALMGTLGLMALPGRLLIGPQMDRWSARRTTLAMLIMIGAGLTFLAVRPSTWGIAGFLIAYGAGAGVLTPARAALVAELFGTSAYGRLNGTFVLPMAVSQAVAPLGGSLVLRATGSYQAVLLGLLCLTLLSALCLLQTEPESE